MKKIMYILLLIIFIICILDNFVIAMTEEEYLIREEYYNKSKTNPVVITINSGAYHLKGCSHINDTPHIFSLSYAQSAGYHPCQYCKPYVSNKSSENLFLNTLKRIILLAPLYIITPVMLRINNRKNYSGKKSIELSLLNCVLVSFYTVLIDFFINKGVILFEPLSAIIWTLVAYIILNASKKNYDFPTTDISK